MDGRLTPRNALLALAAAIFVAFVTVPMACLVLRVPIGQFGHYLRDPMVLQSLWLTLRTTLLSVLLIILFGTPVAYLLAKRQFRGKAVLDALVDLPLSVPPPVAGIALLLTFSPRGPMGHLLADWGLALRGRAIEVVFTMAAVVIAQVFMAAPVYIKAARAGFESVDDGVIRASLVLGASRVRTFLLVTAPFAGSTIVTGIIMAWAKAAGEFGATIAFAGNMQGRTQTAPLAVFVGINRDLNVGVTLAVVLLVFSFAVLLSARILLKRSPT